LAYKNLNSQPVVILGKAFQNNLGKSLRMIRTRTIKQRYFIEAPVDEVFKSLTEPRLLKWFLASAKISPRKGTNYTFTWEGGFSHSGKVLRFLKDRQLSLSWPQYWQGEPLGTTCVSFKLKPKDNGTLLEMTHSGYRNTSPWIEKYGGTCTGWAYYLTNLKSVLQHNRDLRSPHDNF
jgi:uncharacterized protein YndB with AHSA1/START domain